MIWLLKQSKREEINENKMKSDIDIDINKLILILNTFNKLLNNAQLNDGEIHYDVSRNEYENLNEAYNELLHLVLYLKDKNENSKQISRLL